MSSRESKMPATTTEASKIQRESAAISERIKKLSTTSHIVDSDSGRGNTSSSSSSSEDIRQPVIDDADCFVDATEELEADPKSSSSGDDRSDGTELTLDLGDTNESSSSSSSSQAVESLKTRLQETTVILRMALNNEFVRALEICSQRAEQELYAGLANATLSFLRAALTMEPADIEAAVSSINQSFEVSSRMKRKQTIVMRFLYRPNYNSYSDEEIHAELVNAESLLLLALISFLSDQSIICLVRGAFRIRTCYQRYKELLHMMETRTSWQSDEARKHFESGVRMGHGIFNLLMSYLPRRVLRFLEYVGFSGNRSVGVDELDKSVALNDGLRSVFSCLVILTYHSYIENLFGLGCYDSQKVEQLNGYLREHFPKSAFYLLFLGRYHQIQGNLPEAIKTYQDCIEAQNDWRQFHSICHWEIMWCYAVQMDWQKAAHYSDLLRNQSKWSPASYTYQYGTFLYAALVEDERKGLVGACSPEYQQRMAQIVAIMRRVPELRIRYAGKTIPAEKFAITRSMKFLEQQNHLSLPALEFLYIWNIFATLKNSPQQVELLLKRIDSEIEFVEQRRSERPSSQQDQSCDQSEEPRDEEKHLLDDLCLGLLLRGLCLRHLNRLDEAEASFLRVHENETGIQSDTFLIPHSVMELALLKLHQGQHDEARQWIRTARSDYTGYLLETIVHFRLHAASRLIRLEQQQQQQEQQDGDKLSDSFSSATFNEEDANREAATAIQPAAG